MKVIVIAIFGHEESYHIHNILTCDWRKTIKGGDRTNLRTVA